MTPQSEAKTTMQAPFSMPAALLRLEGAVMLISALVFYITLRGSGWLFAALLFVPDVSMIGYLANPRVGSVIYNVVHALLIPVVVLSLGLIMHSDLAAQIALIWLAHIGMDRALGFGIKYPIVFEDTHLQHV